MTDLGLCGIGGPCETMRLALADGWRAVHVDSRRQLWMRHRSVPLNWCPWCGRPVVPEVTYHWPLAELTGHPLPGSAPAPDPQADGSG